METTHDAHDFNPRRAYRRAHSRAEWRMRLADELVRYVVVTALLVLLVRPIGVIVGLVWGLRIARRLYRGEVAPKLRRRLVRRELRRCGHAVGAHEPRARRSTPERLAAHMGDDPSEDRALDWARTALDELAASEGRRPAAGEGRVRVSDLVEDVVDVFEERAESEGIDFRLELDAEGWLEADAARLKAVLLDLVSDSVRALRRGAHGPGRVLVQMGENLAGSEVWVRIRDDRVDAGGGARGVYGSRPVPGIPGATLETQASPRNGVERVLTLSKPRDGAGGPARGSAEAGAGGPARGSAEAGAGGPARGSAEARDGDVA